MRAMLLPLILAAGLLAGCSSTDDATKTDTAGGTGAGGAGAGGISSAGLGGSGAYSPGSQDDLESNVGDTVYFAYDSATIDETSRGVLDRQGEWLNRFPSVQVMVAGYTDDRGTREYNLALGERRAAAVKSYLGAMGVSGSRVTTTSYGEERPLDTSQTDSAYARNRRAQTAVTVTN